MFWIAPREERTTDDRGNRSDRCAARERRSNGRKPTLVDGRHVLRTDVHALASPDLIATLQKVNFRNGD